MKAATLVLCLGLPLYACAREPHAAATTKKDPNIIAMDSQAQKSAGLTVANATVRQLTEYLHVPGTVQPIDSRTGAVRSLARGRVQEVLVRVGDRVTSGQSLARLDNIEAGEIAAQYLAAKAELQKLTLQEANAARQVERNQSLISLGVTSRKEYELSQAEHGAIAEAVKAQESVLAGLDAKLRRLGGVPEADFQKSSITMIRSAFSGVVIRVRVAPGEVVDPDMPLFSITDMSEVWVQAEVYERDLGRVKVGQPALISVDTYPEVTFAGAVAHISDALDPKTRTAQVRCVVPNQDRRLKLDMFVNVQVPTTLSRKVLAVPTSAIQEIEGKTVVFVRQTDRTFQMREVKTGMVAEGQTEIVTGVSAQDVVVVQGAFHLKAVRMNKELGEG